MGRELEAIQARLADVAGWLELNAVLLARDDSPPLADRVEANEDAQQPADPQDGRD